MEESNHRIDSNRFYFTSVESQRRIGWKEHLFAHTPVVPLGEVEQRVRLGAE